MNKQNLEWIGVGHENDLPEGRVKTVTARNVSICLSHFDDQRKLVPILRSRS